MGIYTVGLPAYAQSEYGNSLLEQQKALAQQLSQLSQSPQAFGANSTNVPAYAKSDYGNTLTKQQADLQNTPKSNEGTKGTKGIEGTDWLGWADAGSNVLSSLAGLGQLAMANKQYKLNKESFNYNKEMTNKQWLANVQNYNKTVYDQDRARSSFEGTQQGDYYNQWKQNV